MEKARKKRQNEEQVIGLNRWIRTAAAAAAALYLAAPAAGMAEPTLKETLKYGKVAEAAWTEEDGTVVPGPEGYAIVTYSYNGGDTTEQYFDAEREPWTMPGGYCGILITRDGKRQITGLEYLDDEGKRTLNNLGYGRIRIDFTSFGEAKLVTYYGLGKTPITVPSLGYASVKTEFRGKTMTRRTWLNERGNPVDTAQGYAAMVQKVNKKNQVMTISYEHADGSPAVCPDGWSSCVLERDKDGRELSRKYYGVNGSLTDRGMSYAWEETTYPGKNESRVTRYDLNGKPVEINGYFTLKKQWDGEQLVRESFLDAAGNPVANAQGVGAVRYGYDYAGRLVQVSFEDLQGKAALSSDGYCAFRDVLDEDGTVLVRTFLGTDGKPVQLAGGYSEIRYTYNALRELTDTRYYSTDGIQVQP